MMDTPLRGSLFVDLRHPERRLEVMFTWFDAYLGANRTRCRVYGGKRSTTKIATARLLSPCLYERITESEVAA